MSVYDLPGDWQFAKPAGLQVNNSSVGSGFSASTPARGGSDVSQLLWRLSSLALAPANRKPSHLGSVLGREFQHSFPSVGNRRAENYLSQIRQVVSLQTTCDDWRAKRLNLRSNLLWRLQRCWDQAGEKALGLEGRRHPLVYQARRSLAPLYVSYQDQGDYVGLLAINDHHSIRPVEGRVSWIGWDGEILKEWQVCTTVSAQEMQKIWSLPKTELNSQIGFLHISFNRGDIEASWFSDVPKNLPLQASDIEVTVEGDEVTLYSETPKFYVHLEHGGSGYFSDSCFTLLAREPKTLRYRGEDADKMAASLEVLDLAGSC